MLGKEPRVDKPIIQKLEPLDIFSCQFSFRASTEDSEIIFLEAPENNSPSVGNQAIESVFTLWNKRWSYKRATIPFPRGKSHTNIPRGLTEAWDFIMCQTSYSWRLSSQHKILDSRKLLGKIRFWWAINRSSNICLGIKRSLIGSQRLFFVKFQKLLC